MLYLVVADDKPPTNRIAFSRALVCFAMHTATYIVPTSVYLGMIKDAGE